jgi:hypothetical protein
MDDNKHILFKKLKAKNAFWSYKKADEISDDLLIEKVMLMLDIDDINRLFEIFGKNLVRRVWKNRILRQEPFYHDLNRFYAWFYFDIENPDEFINKRKSYLHNQI